MMEMGSQIWEIRRFFGEKYCKSYKIVWHPHLSVMPDELMNRWGTSGVPPMTLALLKMAF
jgi:hypothetical protein